MNTKLTDETEKLQEQQEQKVKRLNSKTILTDSFDKSLNV